MSRILLADDSPHAQRMGERILADEGYEVVTVSDGDSALVRLEDVDPDLVVADIVMPSRGGFDICQYVKISPRHRHTRVLLTAGVQDAVDEAEIKRVKADGFIRKPFEASVLLETVKPLIQAAEKERPAETRSSSPAKGSRPAPNLPIVALIDPEQVRAAVTLALDASMDKLIAEITEKVLLALSTKPDIPAATPMPDNSFDVVSKIELPEVSNAIQQALKEIHQRYDLKDSKSSIELNEKDNKILLASKDEFKLKAVIEVLESKLVRRQVPLKGLNYGPVTPAAASTVRQEISLQQGIPIEKAREIVKKIKESKAKVQASIQGDFVRVSGRDRDTLQTVMKLLRETDFGIDMQFTNYRTF